MLKGKVCVGHCCAVALFINYLGAVYVDRVIAAVRIGGSARIGPLAILQLWMCEIDAAIETGKVLELRAGLSV
jgi:hypothetical protein